MTIILFICFAVAAGVLGQQRNSQTPEQAGSAAVVLLVVCFLNTSVLTYLILRSRWAGWRLIATICFVFYGVMTFMGQIESAVFLTQLPSGLLPRLFLMGALIAAPFSVLAVLILGKRTTVTIDAEPNTRLVMPHQQMGLETRGHRPRLCDPVFHVWLFHCLAQSSGARVLRRYRRGSFVAHMRTVLGSTPWLIPFQILRAMLWAVIALPVIRMMKGQWRETALALGLLFAELMNAQLLLPNPCMPEAVRMTHLIETATSNLILEYWWVGC